MVHVSINFTNDHRTRVYCGTFNMYRLVRDSTQKNNTTNQRLLVYLPEQPL